MCLGYSHFYYRARLVETGPKAIKTNIVVRSPRADCRVAEFWPSRVVRGWPGRRSLNVLDYVGNYATTFYGNIHTVRF